MKLYLFLKRILDILFSVIALLLLSPVLLLISFVILLQDGIPVVFAQKRAGRLGKPFTLYKFRTMHKQSADCSEHSTEKIIKSGAFLRRFGLDELPQLVNIVKGDMSFIGPRPLLCEYLPFYTDEQARRHNLKPGISGLAQVNGRNAVTWEERLSLDCWYAEHISFLLDLKILVLTVKCLLLSRGVNNSKDYTMPAFKVSKEAALLILGSGGHGRVTAEAAALCKYKRIAFLDDGYPAAKNNNYEILGVFEDAIRFSGEFGNALVALGDNVK